MNHEGSLGRALELITAAADAGAHCAKFQAYKADRLVHESAAPYWDVSRETAKSQRALFRKYDAFGANEYEQLATACADAGIHFACTSFDLEAVAMLDPLVTWWKIASGDITYRALLRAVAATRKPVVFSTGAATWGEIEDALGTMGAVNPGGSVIPLHCILSYPTKPEDVRLATIHTLGEFLRDRWGIQHIGYSDHTMADWSLTALIGAVAHGAAVIEKHFTLNRELPGNDHWHSTNPVLLGHFTDMLERLERMCGKDRKGPLPCEMPAREQARRSAVAARDIPAGTIITEDDVTALRPGTGVPPW